MSIENFNLLDLIIIVLVTFRLSLMMTREDGSLSITYLIRLIGIKPTNKTRLEAYKYSLVRDSYQIHHEIVNHFGKLLSCIWCTSVWVGLLVPYGYYYSQDTIFIYVFYGLALSATTIIIDKYGT